MVKKKRCLMNPDIKNTTVVILLALTILVSIIGTWTVIKTANPASLLSTSQKETQANHAIFADKEVSLPQRFSGNTASNGKMSVTISG